MSSTTKFYRVLALTCHIGLLLWVALWHFYLRDEQAFSTLFILLIYIAPLVFPLPGVIKGKPYTHAWANFIVMFYLIHGLTIMYAESHEWLYALIELVLATGMFIGCAVFARMRGKELGEGLKKLSVVMKEERDKYERG
ncbi:DUF2069 domain-containing protein [Alteromonas facilis]|uniref:DUF2069 domain-containing protein n=1 Tax=Alteromonas facilis TaxID=2048004 RepID=UPI000C28DFE1|nr:DUF2069 domain-containing protein [Alteromonas facilis]